MPVLSQSLWIFANADAKAERQRASQRKHNLVCWLRDVWIPQELPQKRLELQQQGKAGNQFVKIKAREGAWGEEFDLVVAILPESEGNIRYFDPCSQKLLKRNKITPTTL
jgi:hypothetical protein